MRNGQRTRQLALTAALAVAALLATKKANAGFFTLAHFLEPTENSAGFEPEITFTNSGGVAGNLKYQHGLTDFSNGQLTLGTGTGRRRFRVGTAFTYDFLPDVENQPGAGIAASGLYCKYAGFGQLELALAPYAHKVFANGDGHTIEPFLALPIGPSFSDSKYHWQTSINMGAIFTNPGQAKLSYILEFDVGVNKADTMIAGGISFRP